jgi:hypothetical protein
MDIAKDSHTGLQLLVLTDEAPYLLRRNKETQDPPLNFKFELNKA